MLKIIYEQIERLYNYLKEKELLENTIIIYVSDHGDFFGEYGLIRKGPGLPEVLCRIPLVIVGPGIKAKKEKCMDYLKEQYASAYIEQGAVGLYFKNEDIDNLIPENKGIAESGLNHELTMKILFS